MTIATDQLNLPITNNHGSDITINEFYSTWVMQPVSQKLSKILVDTNTIWNISDNDSPSSIPLEGNWTNNSSLIIPADATPHNLVVQFQNPLQTTGYKVYVTFDIGCQVVGTK